MIYSFFLKPEDKEREYEKLLSKLLFFNPIPEEESILVKELSSLINEVENRKCEPKKLAEFLKSNIYIQSCKTLLRMALKDPKIDKLFSGEALKLFWQNQIDQSSLKTPNDKQLFLREPYKLMKAMEFCKEYDVAANRILATEIYNQEDEEKLQNHAIDMLYKAVESGDSYCRFFLLDEYIKFVWFLRLKAKYLSEKNSDKKFFDILTILGCSKETRRVKLQEFRIFFKDEKELNKEIKSSWRLNYLILKLQNDKIKNEQHFVDEIIIPFVEETIIQEEGICGKIMASYFYYSLGKYYTQIDERKSMNFHVKSLLNYVHAYVEKEQSGQDVFKRAFNGHFLYGRFKTWKDVLNNIKNFENYELVRFALVKELLIKKPNPPQESKTLTS